MVISLQEKISITFWWIVAVGVTAYLAVGIIETLVVILR